MGGSDRDERLPEGERSDLSVDGLAAGGMATLRSRAATLRSKSADSRPRGGRHDLALPCLALPCLALPCLALPCLALPCLALYADKR